MPIGRWVLHQACTQAAGWQADDHPVAIAVNLSRRQVDSEALIGDVQAALDASGLDPALLILEIAETVLVGNGGVTAFRLNQLKAMGVRLAIDDFGTGYSSLAYLQQFPVDILKIDRSFIDAIGNQPAADAISAPWSISDRPFASRPWPRASSSTSRSTS